jgi:hypothetical protein
MGNQVYANMMEVSCKAAAGKSICAFPDVCMTPPQTPATPPGVPIPYPNTGMASDCTDGSSTVKISGQEVMLKNKSYFKKSTGDEAGAAPMKGVITHKNAGKVYFTAWSMDVKVEGENVVRHFDVTTGNHASPTANAAIPWAHIDQMSSRVQTKCAGDIDKAADSCQGSTPPDACTDACRKHQKCILVPKGNAAQRCCAPSSTGHHMIEDHWIQGNPAFPAQTQNSPGYSGYNRAPTVCVEGSRADGEHGLMHALQGVQEDSHLPTGINANKPWNYSAGKRAAVRAHQVTFMNSDCSKECLEAQLDAFYGSDPNRPLQQSSGRQGVEQGQISREEAEVLLDTYFG